MKYEIIFGDDLFVECKNDKHMVAVHYKPMNGRYYPDIIRTYRDMADALNTEIPHMYADAVAMRRIIQEPKRWTMDDKISGEGPNIGDILMLGGLTVEFIGISLIDNYEWYVRHPSGRCESANFKYFYPSETPEEKAARLRSEWVNKAYVDFHRLGCELEVLQKEQIKQIYDALLSGELTMPGKVDE